jgi:hypothetical protein
MQIGNWIDDRNLIPFAKSISWLCSYNFDNTDEEAIILGAKKVDESKNVWFNCEFIGDFTIFFSFTIEPGSSNYSIEIKSEQDISQAVNAIIAIAQSYELKNFE